MTALFSFWGAWGAIFGVQANRSGWPIQKIIFFFLLQLLFFLFFAPFAPQKEKRIGKSNI